jgi:hypothetical protein
MPGDTAQRREHIRALHDMLLDACTVKGMAIELSLPRIGEIIQHNARDLERLEAHQGEAPSATKRIAGLAFWIRRLKPIIYGCPAGDEETEIQDINEQAAVWVMCKLMIKYCDQPDVHPLVRSLQRTGGIKNRFSKYLAAHLGAGSEWVNFSSLVYSMRYRNFSPHHLAIYMDCIYTGFALSDTTILDRESGRTGL